MCIWVEFTRANPLLVLTVAGSLPIMQPVGTGWKLRVAVGQPAVVMVSAELYNYAPTEQMSKLASDCRRR
jgi:hypothetical protein